MQSVSCVQCDLEIGSLLSGSGIVFQADLLFAETSRDSGVLKAKCPACLTTLAYKDLATGQLMIRKDKINTNFANGDSCLSRLVTWKGRHP